MRAPAVLFSAWAAVEGCRRPTAGTLLALERSSVDFPVKRAARAGNPKLRKPSFTLTASSWSVTLDLQQEGKSPGCRGRKQSSLVGRRLGGSKKKHFAPTPQTIATGTPQLPSQLNKLVRVAFSADGVCPSVRSGVLSWCCRAERLYLVPILPSSIFVELQQEV